MGESGRAIDPKQQTIDVLPGVSRRNRLGGIEISRKQPCAVFCSEGPCYDLLGRVRSVTLLLIGWRHAGTPLKGEASVYPVKPIREGFSALS
ncbi:MAG: hypothetical protein ACRED0_00130 [Gammaproteobacteria bacterium]